MNMGYERREAAAKATSQIGWAVVSATATTVFAFLPIVLLRDVTGEFIRSMPVTVIFTLSASLLISLTLTLYLSSFFLRPDGKRRLGVKAGGFPAALFQRLLVFALKRRVLVVALTVAVFAGVLALFPVLGVSLFPKAEKPQLIINIDAPEGTSLDKTDAIARQVESILLQREEVEHVATNVGKGNPRIYYNVFSPSEQSNHSQMFVQLKEYRADEMNRLIEELRQTFRGFSGASVEVKELLQGPPVEAPIAIKVIGDNLDVLETLAREVEQIVASTEGTVNVNNPLGTRKTDLRVRIHRDKAATLGVPLAEIDRTVRAGITGITVSAYRDEEGKEYDIVVRLPFGNERAKPAVSDFDRIYVGSLSGAAVPLKQLAVLEFQSSASSISHYNMERAVSITADVAGDRSVDRTTRAILERLDVYSWPRGYRYYAAGELESRLESFGGLQQAILIAVIAIFAILVLQFRSYTQPLIVFTAIPLAVIGSVLALFITRNSFSFSAFIGLTGLIGIVINNSILLVEYANQLRVQGRDLYGAVKEAAAVRFKPIVLTTLTTVGGLLPLTLRGGTMWAPFGWTIIGGLVSSTLLTLVVVPVLYTFFSRK
jgi:multidrug efflux pump subunit AcrB